MGRFGFIIHPLSLKDMARKFAFADKIPYNIVIKVMEKLPPIKASEISGIESLYGKAEGCFVAVPLLPEQMLGLPPDLVQKKIIKACRVAEKMGAEIIGLGAFTSVIGDKGLSIAKELSVPVTTGNTYTVATALDAVKEACKILGRDLNRSEIVIVGANGAIGRACAKILSREARFLSLVSRDMDGLEGLAKEIMMETGLSVHISDQIKGPVGRADVVIAVSSSADPIIHPQHLKRGALVCDVARPRDVSAEVSEKRKDVMVIEGGLIEVPGDTRFNFDFGLPPKTCYACMAETMILTLEKRYESYSLGSRLDVEKVLEISRLAKKHGFKLAGFRGNGRVLGFNDIKRLKEKAPGDAV